jgi:hypothetical protein
LGHSDGQFELLAPLKFFLVRFAQAWTDRDEAYNLRKVTFRFPGRTSVLKEEFLALTLVILPGDKMTPTVSWFGGTKAGAIRPAALALNNAGTPAWLKISPAHAASAKCLLPFGRFLTTVTVEPRRTKDLGRPYSLAVGHVAPTTLEEITSLDRALQDGEFRARFEEGFQVFQVRLSDLKNAASGGDVV